MGDASHDRIERVIRNVQDIARGVGIPCPTGMLQAVRVAGEVCFVLAEFPMHPLEIALQVREPGREKLTLADRKTRLRALGFAESDLCESNLFIYGFLLIEIAEMLGWTHYFAKSVEDFELDYPKVKLSDVNLRCCNLTRVLLHFVEADNGMTYIRKVVGHLCGVSHITGGKRKVYPINEFVKFEGKRQMNPAVTSQRGSSPPAPSQPESITGAVFAEVPDELEGYVIDDSHVHGAWVPTGAALRVGVIGAAEVSRAAAEAVRGEYSVLDDESFLGDGDDMLPFDDLDDSDDSVEQQVPTDGSDLSWKQGLAEFAQRDDDGVAAKRVCRSPSGEMVTGI